MLSQVPTAPIRASRVSFCQSSESNAQTLLWIQPLYAYVLSLIGALSWQDLALCFFALFGGFPAAFATLALGALA